MIAKQIAKLFFVVMLTVAATVGLGVAADQVGLTQAPSAYACGHGGGGGC